MKQVTCTNQSNSNPDISYMCFVLILMDFFRPGSLTSDGGEL
jgi:hypothetical protein